MDKYLLNGLMTIERKCRKRKRNVEKGELYLGGACGHPGGEMLPVLSSEKGLGQKLQIWKSGMQTVKEGKMWAGVILGRGEEGGEALTRAYAPDRHLVGRPCYDARVSQPL